jgi:tRNA wybutosine-synthesizing protein 2
MGFFGETYQFLPTAFQCLHNQKGIIHYHDTFPDNKVPKQALKQIREVAETFDRNVVLQHVQHVKSYAPGISHYVFDVNIVEN